MSVERLLPQMLMSTAAILVGILLVLMGLLRIGRSIKFHHHHRIFLQQPLFTHFFGDDGVYASAVSKGGEGHKE